MSAVPAGPSCLTSSYTAEPSEAEIGGSVKRPKKCLHIPSFLVWFLLFIQIFMLNFTRLLHFSINLLLPLKAVENPVLLTSPGCILSLQLKSSQNLARLGTKVTVVPVKTIPSIMCACHQVTLVKSSALS